MSESQGRISKKELLWNAEDAGDFSQLTYLLQLVLTLNLNDNLQSSCHRHKNRGRKATLRDEQSLNVTLLDSIVAILVQQHEVVAACYSSDKITVMVAETDPSTSTDPLDTFVESPIPGQSYKFYPLTLAAVSNPDFNSSLPESNNNPHNLQVLATGEDLWIGVRDSYRWYCALMWVF